MSNFLIKSFFPTQLDRKGFFVAAILLIAFNFWHSTIRGIWNHSIFDSLTIGEQTLPLAQSVDPRIHPWKSYDGQFYYAMTFDPLLISKESVHYIDWPVYRYRRMLYPLLSHLFVLGDPRFFPYSLFWINIAAWILLLIALWKIAKLESLPAGWMVLCGLTTTGITYATFRTLPETLSMALSLWGCYFWLRRSKSFSAVLFSFSSLARETAVLVPFCIFIYELCKRNEVRLRIFLFGLIAAVPPLLWCLYVTLRLPEFQFPGTQFFSFPFLGIFQEIWVSLHQNTSIMEHKRTLTIVILTVLLIVVIACYFWRYPTFWGGLAFGQAVFCAIVKGGVWEYHAGSVRAIIPLTIFSVIWFFEIAKFTKTQVSEERRVNENN